MVRRSSTFISIFALAAIVVTSGCAGHDFEESASRPGKFRLYDCASLDKQGAELLKRERELDNLMQKARQSPGGEIAIAAAYQSEYNTVRGDIQAIETTGAERRCVLKFRTVSERAIR